MVGESELLEEMIEDSSGHRYVLVPVASGDSCEEVVALYRCLDIALLLMVSQTQSCLKHVSH